MVTGRTFPWGGSAVQRHIGRKDDVLFGSEERFAEYIRIKPQIPGQMDAAVIAEGADRQDMSTLDGCIDRMRVSGIRLPRFLGNVLAVLGRSLG